MKRSNYVILFVLMAAVMVAGLSCKKKSTFGELLIECEESVRPESMTPKWPERKTAWVQDVKSAGDDTGALKRLVIEFETNIEYSAQKANWRARREGWLEQINNAHALTQLRDLLIELESSFTFSTQQESWLDKRGDWFNRLQSVE